MSHHNLRVGKIHACGWLRRRGEAGCVTAGVSLRLSRPNLPISVRFRENFASLHAVSAGTCASNGRQTGYDAPCKHDEIRMNLTTGAFQNVIAPRPGQHIIPSPDRTPYSATLYDSEIAP